MKRMRIRRMDPIQLGKVFAIIYVIMIVLLMPIFLFQMLLAQDAKVSFFLVFIILFMLGLYPLIGFFTGIVSAAIYNFAARLTGGVEIVLEECDQDQEEQETAE